MIDPAEMGELLQPLPEAPDKAYWDRQRALAQLRRRAEERRN